jgi:hypothetical protein
VRARGEDRARTRERETLSARARVSEGARERGRARVKERSRARLASPARRLWRLAPIDMRPYLVYRVSPCTKRRRHGFRKRCQQTRLDVWHLNCSRLHFTHALQQAKTVRVWWYCTTVRVWWYCTTVRVWWYCTTVRVWWYCCQRPTQAWWYKSQNDYLYGRSHRRCSGKSKAPKT